MNPIMKLAAVAVGALAIAGGAALAQTGSPAAGDSSTMPSNANAAGTDGMSNANSSTSTNDMNNGNASSTDNSAPSPRADRN